MERTATVPSTVAGIPVSPRWAARPALPWSAPDVAHRARIDRARRRSEVKVLPDHARLTRELKVQLDEWQRQHAANRSAYKQLVRTQHGRVDARARDSHDGSQ